MFLQKLINKGVALTQNILITGDTSGSRAPSRWRENHGNLLMAFVAIVFLLGASVLIYRQNRFVAPRFPESNMITLPMRASDLTPVAEKNAMTIRVVGAANDNGTVRIEIYDSESSFNKPASALISKSVLIRDGEAIWTVPVKMPETFSIAAFHDENSDGELNRNRLEVPTERYGYSRNARGTTGVPMYEEAVIERPNSGEMVNIFIR